MTPPNCPNPSFSTQFRVAANGNDADDDDPIPIAISNDCIDNTPDALPNIVAII